MAEGAIKTMFGGGRNKQPGRPIDKKLQRRLIVWGSVGVALLLVLVGSLVYTESSGFCPTCHEMGPYYEAWAQGPHARSAQCVDCHVDAGIIAHLAHKPVALKEVWDHFFSVNKFPNFTADIPNSRCLGCHTNIPETKPGLAFSHKTHEKFGQCKNCHTQAGHLVTLASLDAAGILKPAVTAPVPGGQTPSGISGHKKVVCQDCHDQATMKCSACHQPPHEDRGDCSNCHKVGESFLAGHPSGTDCSAAGCHTPPANHFGPDCGACHTPGTPFAQATFNHPQTHHNYRKIACVKCHPNGYTTSYCSCHNGNPPND